MDGYSIGQVSKILQMPQQTVRFLEEKGLVAPKRSEHNGYRYFSYEDVGHLVDYRWYRDAGYSLQESVDAIVNRDLFQSANLMRKVQKRAEAEARRQTLVARRLKSYQEKLDEEYLASHIGTVEIARSPAVYWRMNAVAGMGKVKYKPASQLQEWFAMVLESYCFISHIMYVYAESLVDNRPDYGTAWGYGIETTWANELGLDLAHDAAPIPSQTSLTTIIRVKHGESPIRSIREAITPFLHDSDLDLSGDVWGIELVTIPEKDGDASYIEIWAPVKNSEDSSQA